MTTLDKGEWPKGQFGNIRVPLSKGGMSDLEEWWGINMLLCNCPPEDTKPTDKRNVDVWCLNCGGLISMQDPLV